MLKLFLLPRRFVALLISLYQKTLSPDHGWPRVLFPNGYCRFYPTCSEYAKRAVLKYGFFVGIPKSIWRICRCNPWNDGGHDEP